MMLSPFHAPAVTIAAASTPSTISHHGGGAELAADGRAAGVVSGAPVEADGALRNAFVEARASADGAVAAGAGVAADTLGVRPTPALPEASLPLVFVCNEGTGAWSRLWNCGGGAEKDRVSDAAAYGV